MGAMPPKAIKTIEEEIFYEYAKRAKYRCTIRKRPRTGVNDIMNVF
jgi:hypothetical protein